MKTNHSYTLSFILFRILINIILFSTTLQTSDPNSVLYINLEGTINKLQIIHSDNNEDISYDSSSTQIIKNVYYSFGDTIEITFNTNSFFNQDIFSIGLVLEINNDLYSINDGKTLTTFSNSNIDCDQTTSFLINSNYKKFYYCTCDSENLETYIITFKIPNNSQKICHPYCSDCTSSFITEYSNTNEKIYVTQMNCISCSQLTSIKFIQINDFCFKETDSTLKKFDKFPAVPEDSKISSCKEENSNYAIYENTYICIIKPSNSYYISELTGVIGDCHSSCKTCNGKLYNNCIQCDNINYFKATNFLNQCLSMEQIPSNYYYDSQNNIYSPCYFSCSKCNEYSNSTSHNCLLCDNSNNYHFHPSINNNCIKYNELPDVSYYLDNSDDKYKKCNTSCLTCSGKNKNECLTCDGVNYFTVEYYDNQCLKLIEIPINYYKFFSNRGIKYYKCHESCKTCYSGEEGNCLTCDIDAGYYPVIDIENTCLSLNQIPNKYYFENEEKIIKKCHENCETCTKGYNSTTQEMNCDTCISGKYFQNITSTNCIEKPYTKYYVKKYNEKETLFPCYFSCEICEEGGNITNHNCLNCSESYYFDDEILTNCVDDDIECGIGCAKCFKNKTDNNLGILSADKMCKRCSHKSGYYPLEKSSNEQFYVSCYPINKSPSNYFFDKNLNIHRLCYSTCNKCDKIGNYLNNSCISCENNYFSPEEEKYNCYPICEYYYYFNLYNQYKCTSTKECPTEIPYLILNKTKCVSNCYKDDKFNLMYKNECLERCPEGTFADLYIYNGEITAQCVTSNETFDKSECVLNSMNTGLEFEELTTETMQNFAEKYIRDFPIVNYYVDSYNSPIKENSNSKYLIVIYKNEKCAKEKVEGYVSLGLDDCINKVKTSNEILKNIVVQILYRTIQNSPPQISFSLYHPDTGKKLNTTICEGTKLAVKSSLFDNGSVDEKLVKYFSNMGINIFNINDPFFTDICFTYETNGEDVTLNDRIDLYYQNISLCENGCTYVGVNLETYEVECQCDIQTTSSSKSLTKEILADSLSHEVFGVLTDSNIEVLKCFKYVFKIKLFFKNYGGLMMIFLLMVQIIISIFVYLQFKTIRKYIYWDLLKMKVNPPKRKSNIYINNKNENKNNEQNDINVGNNIDNNNKTMTSNLSNFNKRGSKERLSTFLNDDMIIRSSSKTKTFRKEKNNINDKTSDNSLTNNNEDKNKLNNIPYNKCSNTVTIFKKIPSNRQKNSPIKSNSILKNTAYSSFIHLRENKNQTEKEKKEEIKKFTINDNNNKNIFNSNVINSGCKKDNELKCIELKSYSNNNNINNDLSNNDNNMNKNSTRKSFFTYRKGVGTYLENKNQKPCSNNNNPLSNFHNDNLSKNSKYKDVFINYFLNNNDDDNKNCISKKKTINFSIQDQSKELKFFDDQNSNSNNLNSVLYGDNSMKQKELEKAIKKKILLKMRKKRIEKLQNEKYEKENIVIFENKQYSESELNELDYEEAIIYDKRKFCKIIWMILKERQEIINTFFVKDPLKPLPIKLLVLIFSLSCYFVINGFLYNEEYVSKKLKQEGSKTLYEYINDSIDRILYTSIVGGIITFIIGILFNSEKKINKAMNKYKDNKIVLRGQISKIYRCNKNQLIYFVIIQLLLMILFLVYISCFCYVYPNNQDDWFESSLIVIGIMQLVPFGSSLIIAMLKFCSIKFENEFCFNIYNWLADNI